MHTNATVSLTDNDRTAELTLNGQKMVATILEPADARFATQENPTRLSSDPALPSGQTDQPNDGVTLLTIDVGTGTNTIAVTFT